MKLCELTCAGCGARFSKALGEVRRQRKRNAARAFYCGMACYARAKGHANLGTSLGFGRPELLDSANRQDAYSPFRYFMKKARNRRYGTDLDLAYLRELWEAQQGRCALSGVPMTMPKNSLAWERQTRDPWKPSLDRIESERGYVKGNVRYVCVIGNLAKSAFRDEDVFAFCRAVVAHHADGDLVRDGPAPQYSHVVPPRRVPERPSPPYGISRSAGLTASTSHTPFSAR